MKSVCPSIFLLLIALLGISACTPQPLMTPTPSPTLDGTLRPYPSDTPTQTPVPTDYISPTSSPTITPTFTPVYYNVLPDDDMYAIAFRYGISPQALMTANPTVNPRFMGVGTVLLIPLTPMPDASPSPTIQLSPTPTPLYSRLHEPNCYQDGSGGLWCFVLVENDFPGDLENVGGLVTLTDLESEETRHEIAIMPLNILPTGSALPMVAYFNPPLPRKFNVSAQVDVLLPVPEDDDRYLSIIISNQQINYAEDDLSAQLSGQVSLAAGLPTAKSVWVLAVAFDSEGRVIAIRRWEAQSSLLPGRSQTFQINIYSLGAPIDHIELVAEARPQLP